MLPEKVCMQRDWSWALGMQNLDHGALRLTEIVLPESRLSELSPKSGHVFPGRSKEINCLYARTHLQTLNVITQVITMPDGHKATEY